MAYQTGTATDQTDLINKLQTFAAANGFTVDNYDGTNRFCSISRPADDLYMTFYWNAVDTIAMYQALGYSAGSAQTPWTQTDDSGNGHNVLGSIANNGRRVSYIGNGPFTAYHFFAYTDPYAIHVVLEFSSGLYRHFAFGSIQKASVWTGGAFVAGHLWNTGNSYSVYDDPTSYGHSLLLDEECVPQTVGYYIENMNSGATLHIEGFESQGQPTGGKWGHCVANSTNDVYLGNDRGGTGRIRILGGCRGGVVLRQLGWMLPDLSNGFIPIIPFEVFYHEGYTGSNKNRYYLGRLVNVGHIHLEGIDPAQEITVGSDTWIAFPAVRKSNIGSNNQESWNMGIIYKKVT